MDNLRILKKTSIQNQAYQLLSTSSFAISNKELFGNITFMLKNLPYFKNNEKVVGFLKIMTNFEAFCFTIS